MALFGKKDEKKQKDAAPKAADSTDAPKGEVKVGGVNPSAVLVKPHITEKSFLAGEHNVYVFQVTKSSTKADVARAIESAYNVAPRQVRIVNTPGKTASRRTAGRVGRKSGIKKAYVYLKEGDKLTLA